ncbi:MAG: alpha/beta fold hydrolase [Candidatus Sungbacteria bacterium]|uniref:Alpha/beta fold hydrolase n=1 Tax=Candidatus Sungiibacteriota bacterium TaxID=2750080 RepID=A0A932YW17_9BACT|nr:alpha/beta fold hydrolase [Candidatus Sungbacteria bacterium]
MSQRVEFKTSDDVLIVGDYYAPAAPSERGLLLLHMMPAARSSWRTLAEKIRAKNFHVVAIDLRGHGDSSGGPNGYKNFTDAEHQVSSLDLEAAVGFLKSKGVSEFFLGGASIGANLALGYLAGHAEAQAAFLLSPGLDYRGVKTYDAAKALQAGQAVYYAASRDDAYSADTIQQLFDVTPDGVKKEMKLFEAAGHGTTMFDREPSFMEAIVSWLIVQ